MTREAAMAQKCFADGHLIDRLPAVRGRLTAGAQLDGITWFRVGGPAEVMFRPADAFDLAEFLAACPADVPVTVVGVASNLLIRDGGIPGVVIRLGGPFAALRIDGTTVSVGAGALDLNIALAARLAGVAGLEFLSGIPGTIGGALRMNAGAFGRELSDVLVSAEAVDRAGRCFTVPVAELGLSYRRCAAPADWIFVGATLQGEPGEPAEITARIDDIARKRAESQPVRAAPPSPIRPATRPGS